ncbi:MAG: hypothetical protein ACM3ZC_10910 [Bacteroidota bacterium]
MLGFIRRGQSRRILQALAVEDAREREQAKKRLGEHSFSRMDLPLLYGATRRGYPDDGEDLFSTRSKLLRVLWEVNDAGTPRFIADIYPSLPDNKDTRFAALRVLSGMNTRESVETLVKILLRDKPDLGYAYPLFLPFEEEPRHASLLFPRLFNLLEDDKYKYAVYCLAVSLRDKKALDDKVFQACRGRLLEDLAHARAQRRRLAKDTEAYAEAVDLLAVTADCLGAFPGDAEVMGFLRSLLDDPSPEVVLWAADSLTRNGGNVPGPVFLKLAANPETRLDLYNALAAAGQVRLFPEEYLTQYHFAEADMVRWLTFPTEFGRAPDRIELLAEKEVETDGERGRVYLFKYRYAGDEDGWMVGLSGPQPMEKDEVATGGGYTFSHFKRLDEMSVEEHFRSFLD